MKASQDEEEVLLAVEESLARRTMGMLLLKEEESSSDLDQKDTNAEISNKNRNIEDPRAIPVSLYLRLFKMPSRIKSVCNTTAHGNSSIPDNQITRHLYNKWVPWHPPGR